MEREQIAKKLIEVVSIYVRDRNRLHAITEDSTLIQELGINSLDLVDILLEVETTFDITIEGNESESLNRVGNALDLIERKLQAKTVALA